MVLANPKNVFSCQDRTFYHFPAKKQTIKKKPVKTCSLIIITNPKINMAIQITNVASLSQ
jgi:hypothetical protein